MTSPTQAGHEVHPERGAAARLVARHPRSLSLTPEWEWKAKLCRCACAPADSAWRHDFGRTRKGGRQRRRALWLTYSPQNCWNFCLPARPICGLREDQFRFCNIYGPFVVSQNLNGLDKLQDVLFFLQLF
jgi:hypothetical protein